MRKPFINPKAVEYYLWSNPTAHFKKVTKQNLLDMFRHLESNFPEQASWSREGRREMKIAELQTLFETEVLPCGESIRKEHAKRKRRTEAKFDRGGSHEQKKLDPGDEVSNRAPHIAGGVHLSPPLESLDKSKGLPEVLASKILDVLQSMNEDHQILYPHDLPEVSNYVATQDKIMQLQDFEFSHAPYLRIRYVGNQPLSVATTLENLMGIRPLVLECRSAALLAMLEGHRQVLGNDELDRLLKSWDYNTLDTASIDELPFWNVETAYTSARGMELINKDIVLARGDLVYIRGAPFANSFKPNSGHHGFNAFVVDSSNRHNPIFRVFNSRGDRLISLTELQQAMQEAYDAPLTFADILSVQERYLTRPEDSAQGYHMPHKHTWSVLLQENGDSLEEICKRGQSLTIKEHTRPCGIVIPAPFRRGGTVGITKVNHGFKVASEEMLKMKSKQLTCTLSGGRMLTPNVAIGEFIDSCLVEPGKHLFGGIIFVGGQSSDREFWIKRAIERIQLAMSDCCFAHCIRPPSDMKTNATCDDEDEWYSRDVLCLELSHSGEQDLIVAQRALEFAKKYGKKLLLTHEHLPRDGFVWPLLSNMYFIGL